MARWIDRRRIYVGNILTVSTGQVQMPNGATVNFDLVEHNGGVGVVPLLGDSVLLVRQQRAAIALDLLEIPAGKLEGAGDDVVARAQAELEEETGYRAGRLELAADFFVSPGYLTERIYVYLAFDLEYIGAHPESSEEIEVVRVPLDQVRHMLDAHEFRDSKTIIGLREMLAYLERHPDGRKGDFS